MSANWLPQKNQKSITKFIADHVKPRSCMLLGELLLSKRLKVEPVYNNRKFNVIEKQIKQKQF